MIQYLSVVEHIHLFMNQQDTIKYLLRRIKVMFFEPETTIIEQFDNKNKDIYFTDEGICYLY